MNKPHEIVRWRQCSMAHVYSVSWLEWRWPCRDRGSHWRQLNQHHPIRQNTSLPMCAHARHKSSPMHFYTTAAQKKMRHTCNFIEAFWYEKPKLKTNVTQTDLFVPARLASPCLRVIHDVVSDKKCGLKLSSIKARRERKTDLRHERKLTDWNRFTWVQQRTINQTTNGNKIKLNTYICILSTAKFIKNFSAVIKSTDTSNQKQPMTCTQLLTISTHQPSRRAVRRSSSEGVERQR